MKITFVLPYAGLSGGIRVAAIYADRLQRRGHEVFVVSTPGPQLTWRERVRSLLQGQGWPATPTEASYFAGLNVPHHIIERNKIVTDADVPDADVVVATWWETAEWVNALSDSKGAKAYFIQHHEVFDYTPKDRVQATYRMPMHKITISKWLIELMREQYGDAQVSFVPNSVDTRQFYAPPRQKQAVPTVGLLYSVVPWKGCDISFEALSIVAKHLPNVKLVAFGNDEPSAELPLPAGTEYSLRPAQDRIKDIYASCDVWLCGSRGEGFHLPPLEAMACRCPVVSTEVGGPIDTIENGVNGYLVPLEDAEALAERLLQVLTLSEADWRQMSDAAYATATQYTWDDAAALFEQALDRAIERRQQGTLRALEPVRGSS